MYAYAKGSWDSAATLDQISDDYFRSLYGPAAKSMQAHQQAARALFDAEFGHGETGEEMLFGFRIKKFDPAHEASSKATIQRWRCANERMSGRGRVHIRPIRGSARESKSSTRTRSSWGTSTAS